MPDPSDQTTDPAIDPVTDPAAGASGPPLPDSYEAARDELVETVRRLEAGGTTLEESIALWERGEALADACQRWLDGARSRLEAASADDE